jgi:uncharacterized protein (DUF1786 family)
MNNPDKILVNCPKSLLIDIGTGTKDILCFDPGKTIENNLKFVVPTPGLKYAKTIANAKKDICISGNTIGGGKLASAIKKHLKKGFQVSMTQEAAFSLRNCIEDIHSMGIKVVSHADSPDIVFDELELLTYFEILEKIGEDPFDIDLLGLSVQDHGAHNHGESSRKRRFDFIYSKLKEKQSLTDLIFLENEIPEYLPRMISGAKAIKKIPSIKKTIFMDTCISAILGCIFDERVKILSGPVLYLNFGNGHTFACIMNRLTILAFYEHHTGLISKNLTELGKDLLELCKGNLKFEKVFNDGGHGCMTFESISLNQLSGIVVTGPQRHLAQNLNLPTNYIETAPGGDMMMTGPFGLLRGYALRKEP